MIDARNHSPEFFKAAIDLGFGLFGAGMVEGHPDRLARAFGERIAFAAKYLSKASGLKRSHAYEALAKGGRFSNWHHLSQHLKIPDGGKTDVGGAWFTSLSPLLPLLVEVDRELPVPGEAREPITDFWSRVAEAAGSDVSAILDGVAARMLGEKTWKALVERSPLNATGTLYRFVVTESGKEGRFRTSSACSALVEQLDDSFQGYGDLPVPERVKARKVVEEIAAKRPDFLEGQLALASVLQTEGDPGAVAVLDAALERAEGLIPEGFRGKIIWSELDNRFYHRMLWMRFEMHRDKGRTAKAVSMARKMLRLNPNDNLGARFELPTLLLMSGKYPEAERACGPLRAEGQRQGDAPSATMAFVAFANGHEREFRQHLLRSLFTWPMLRAFLRNNADKVTDWESLSRGVLPDFEAFANSAWPIYVSLPGLRDACLALISRRDVVAAEEELGRFWRGFWRVRPHEAKVGSPREWRERVELHIAALSA